LILHAELELNPGASALKEAKPRMGRVAPGFQCLGDSRVILHAEMELSSNKFARVKSGPTNIDDFISLQTPLIAFLLQENWVQENG